MSVVQESSKGFVTSLYGATQVAEIDRAVMRARGLSDYELMLEAGSAIFDCLQTHWSQAERLVVFCGPGNNGGDGYVLARLATKAGYRVEVCAKEWPRAGTAAAEAAEQWRAGGGSIGALGSISLDSADVIADALFGAGLNRAPEGWFAEAIEAINDCDTPVLAVDVPSGLVGDTGQAYAPTVRAARTVMLVALKLGGFTGDGPNYCGHISGADLGSAHVDHTTQPLAQRLRPQLLPDLIPARAPGIHKGAAGHVLVIAGNRGMGGAAALCADGALRGGAGLVSAIVHDDYCAPLLSRRPEAMWHGASSASFRDSIDAAKAIAIGPGLGQDAWAQSLWRALSDSDVARVVDADGLYWLKNEPLPVAVITPHPGEAARLLGTSIGDVQSDRRAAARALARRYNTVCVLKGLGSIISDGERAWLCDRGTPAMATAGLGDVLCGLVAALLAQGLTPVDAACGATLLHALSGEVAAEGADRGLLASDLAKLLPQVLRDAAACDDRLQVLP